MQEIKRLRGVRVMGGKEARKGQRKARLKMLQAFKAKEGPLYESGGHTTGVGSVSAKKSTAKVGTVKKLPHCHKCGQRTKGHPRQGGVLVCAPKA